MTDTVLKRDLVQDLVNNITAEHPLSLEEDVYQEPEQVIAGIVCPSYSGSTLLTALLGSHSKIFGAGELHWLLSEDRNQVQKIIEKSEKLLQTNLIWKELFDKKMSPEGLYDVIFSKTDCPVIIDSSKRPHFFEAIVPLNATRNFLFIYLLKHPMRLLASHIMHRSATPEFASMERRPMIDAFLNDIYQQIVYQHLISSKIGVGNRILFVKYEGLVAQTVDTLRYILRELGLAFEPGMLDFRQKEHQMLGGNAGPRSQISRTRSGDEVNFTSEIQKAFYQNLDSIKLDNNYQAFFSPDEIAWLNSCEKMHTLLHILGYKPIS